MTAPYYIHSNKNAARPKYTSVVKSYGDNKRYFSNVECEFYFGSKRFTDVVDFAFQVQEQPLEIYGYNSFTPNLIAQGRKSIMGSFRINFLKGGGFTEFLKSVEDSVKYNKNKDKIKECPDSTTTWGNKVFDVLIGFGYFKGASLTTFNATCQCLLGVRIVGMSKEIDTTGTPITEVYSFVAQDYIERDFNEMENKEEKDNNKEDNKKQESQEGYKMADKRDPNQAALVEETCKNNEKTTGIVSDVVYSPKTKNIRVELDLHNKSKLNISNMKLDILDQRIGPSITIPLKNTSNTQGKMIFSSTRLSSATNNKINNILKGKGQKKLRAKISFNCDELNEKSPVKSTVYVYPENNK